MRRVESGVLSALNFFQLRLLAATDDIHRHRLRQVLGLLKE